MKHLAAFCVFSLKFGRIRTRARTSSITVRSGVLVQLQSGD